MSRDPYAIRPIGFVRSKLIRMEDAPLQGDEGAPAAWLEFDSSLEPALRGIAVGDALLVLTWFHRAKRDVLQLRPHRKTSGPLFGVFATRSPDRPNPIGLHRVAVLELEGSRLKVAPMEAIDGTPIVDIKPVLD